MLYNEENDYNYGYSGNKKSPFQTAIKKLFKILFWTFIITVNALILWRIFSSGEPKFSKTYIWTQQAIDEYKASEDDFKVYNISKKATITEDITGNGSFSVMSTYYTPSAKQVQFTLCYNNSTLKYLKERYNLSETPKGEVFVCTLTDNNGHMYTEYDFLTHSKNLYNYRRIVFPDIETEGLTSLTLKIYYAQDVLYSVPYAKVDIFNIENRLKAIAKTEDPELFKQDDGNVFGEGDNPSEQIDLKNYLDSFKMEEAFKQLDLSKNMFKNDSPTSGLTHRIEYIVNSKEG